MTRTKYTSGLDPRRSPHRPFLATRSCEGRRITHRERKGDQQPGIENREELCMHSEFMAFLRQYGVISLAIAVIIGGVVPHRRS